MSGQDRTVIASPTAARAVTAPEDQIMALAWPSKDPDEKLDYTIDWVPRLAGDTIASSAWIVPSGITNEAASNTGTTTMIWLSGGTEGVKYTLTNRVTTAGGRIMDQSVSLNIRSR